MFLLILKLMQKLTKWLQTLHSTMFLLIRLLTAWQRQLQFQSLHSTMFLLIHILIEEVSLIGFAFTFHNVSINTVLSAEIIKAMCLFTFHNVSINTETMQVLTVIHSTLHSTMFLLIRLSRTRQDLLLMSLHSTMFLLILR